MKISKSYLQNSSETVINIEHDKEIPKKIYISPEKKKQKIIDDLRLI